MFYVVDTPHAGPSGSPMKGSVGGAKAGEQFKEMAVPSSGHFMAYFVTCIVLVMLGYLFYHNRKKVGRKVRR